MHSWLRQVVFSALVVSVITVGGVLTSQNAFAEGSTRTPIQLAEAEGELGALEFVRKTALNRNFGELIMSFSLRTQTVQGLVLRHGQTAVTTSLLSNTNKIVQIRGQEWDENLASIYAKFFSESEMYSLLHDRNESPYLEKLRQNQQVIGTEMQTLSFDLMQDAVTETVTAVLQEFSALSND